MSCLSLIMVAACTTTPANDLLDSENQQSVNLQNGAESSETLPPGKARVRFVFDGLTFNTSPMTKTDPVGLTDAGVNYLYIYEGETLLLKQTAGESGGSGSGAGGGAGGEFGSPSLVLDYGSHTLTFVASDFELDDTDNQVRSGNTFSARKTVTVDENTTTQSVIMARIKTGLRIVINDSPANLARLNKITIVLNRTYINLLPGDQVVTQHSAAQRQHVHQLRRAPDNPGSTHVLHLLPQLRRGLRPGILRDDEGQRYQHHTLQQKGHCAPPHEPHHRSARHMAHHRDSLHGEYRMGRRVGN